MSLLITLTPKLRKKPPTVSTYILYSKKNTENYIPYIKEQREYVAGITLLWLGNRIAPQAIVAVTILSIICEGERHEYRVNQRLWL
jgi:hypothetical protein